jgi:hypothetical protein
MRKLPKEVAGRILAEAVGYLDQHPEATVEDALHFGSLFEVILHGSPFSAEPVGLMGKSPLTGLFEAFKP